jgi:hypothetical protein
MTAPRRSSRAPVGWLAGLSLLALALGTDPTHAQLANERIRYFGFALVDCGYDDPLDSEAKTNYVDELAGWANLAQLCATDPDENLGARLDAFAHAGVQAALFVEPLLFAAHPDPTTPSGRRLTLRPDAAARWSRFVARNRAHLTPEHIAMLYVADEPVWNGLAAAPFEVALALLKGALPALPTFAVEAFPVVRQALAPAQLDWVGFDRYDRPDPAHDPTWQADYAALRARRTRPDQKIVIVANTEWRPAYAELGLQPKDLAAVAYSYWEVASGDPDVVALAGYLWPGGFDDPAQLGGRNLPASVRAVLREIGEKIVGTARREAQEGSP